jgi:hypothetical protein
MKRRLAINIRWINYALNTLPPAASGLSEKFMDELRGMEQLVSDLPPARLLVGAQR